MCAKVVSFVEKSQYFFIEIHYYLYHVFWRALVGCVRNISPLQALVRALPGYSLKRFHFSCPSLMTVHVWLFLKETGSPSSDIKNRQGMPCEILCKQCWNYRSATALANL